MEVCSQMRTKWTLGSGLVIDGGTDSGLRTQEETQTEPRGRERVIDEVIIGRRRSKLV